MFDDLSMKSWAVFLSWVFHFTLIFGGFRFSGLWLGTMSVICQSLDFGRHVLDYVACGCSSNTPLDPHTVRSHVKLSTKSRKKRHQTRTSICSRRKVGQCRVFSTTKAETILNGKWTFGIWQLLYLNGWLLKLAVIAFVCFFFLLKQTLLVVLNRSSIWGRSPEAQSHRQVCLKL